MSERQQNGHSNNPPDREIVADPDEIAQNEAELEAILQQIPQNVLNQLLAQGGNFAPALLGQLDVMQIPHPIYGGEDFEEHINDENEEENEDEEDPDMNFHNAPIISANDLRDDEDDSDDDNSNASFTRHQLDGHQPSTSNGNNQHAINSRASRLDRRRNRITFDQSLPVNHSYLGPDMNEVKGRTKIYEQGEIVHKMPIFPVPHMILMPGQHLPLHSMHPLSVQLFRRIIQDNKEFAVVSITHRADQEAAQLAPIGTIAQVLTFKEEEESNLTIIKMKAIGRQSFEIVDTYRQLDGSLLADIKILSEHSERLPLIGAEPTSWRRQHNPSMSNIIDPLSLRKMRPSSMRHGRYSCSVLTGVPWFVLRMNDTAVVVQQLLKELKIWMTFDAMKTAQLTSNPMMLSYWVATNLPIGDSTRLELLKITSTLLRLKFELALIRKWSILLCRTCNGRIGEKAALFSMSIDGPMGTYVNAGGHVHDMFTMLEVYGPGVQVIGTPSEENSWFPGYAWTISQCRRCSMHLGWRFSAAANQQLRPRTFWGVARHAIVPSLTMTDDPNCVTNGTQSHSEQDEIDRNERNALTRLLRLDE